MLPLIALNFPGRFWLRKHRRGACVLIGVAVALWLAGASTPASAEEGVIEGPAQVVDGDTLAFGVDHIGLSGIDAPEPEQTCERAGRPWRCGMEATYALAALIEHHWVACRPQAQGPDGEFLADCRIGGPKGFSVNAAIVRQGWALALPMASPQIIAAEQQAKVAKVGLWSGSFVAPWQWRRARAARVGE